MSGSTIGGIVGATIGFFVGAPQLGWMIGSIIGGIVDPQKIQGQRLTDAQGQTASEGVPRPIIYGIAACAGNLIQIGPLVEHKQEQQQGKGGPVQITYTYTRSYAIRICEGPITGVLRVWRNDKLIYDKTNSGSPIAADSAATASKMRFYLGDETQMPDPTLESLPSANGGGSGNVCAHRGTAYCVVTDDDLTDMQGAIPQYKWEVRTCVAPPAPGIAWRDGNTGTAQTVLCTAGGGGIWAIGGNNGSLAISQDNGATWGLIDFTTQLGWSGTWGCDNLWHTDQWYMTSDGFATHYASSSTGGTWDELPTLPLRPVNGSAAVIDGDAWCGVFGASTSQIFQPQSPATTHDFGFAYGDVTAIAKIGSVYLVGTDSGKILSGSSLAGCSLAASAGAKVLGFAGDGTVLIAALGGSQYARSTDGGASWALHIGDWSGVAFFDGLFYATDITGIYFGPDGLSWTQDDNSFYLGISRCFMTQTQFGMLANTAEGKTATSGFVGFSPDLLRMPDAPDYGVDYQGNIVGPPTAILGSCSDELGAIVADICARVGIDSTQIDVSALTNDVRGFLIGQQIAASEAIKTLQQGYFFDFPEWDKKLRGVPRGGNSQFTIGDDELLLEDDNDTTTRAQAVEFPRKLNLVSADPTADYAPTTQTAERRTDDVRAVGEVTVQLPLSLVPAEAVQMADILLKIAWTEAQGTWKRHLPEEYSQMTPSDRFTYNGTRYRVQKGTLESDETLFEAVRDRQSAYTSVATAASGPAPTPPISSMKGPTVFAAMNLPRLRTQDASPGMYIAVQGLLPGWIGCDLQLSVDSGVSFTSVAQLMTASEMGQLTADIGTSTEPIPVEMFADGQLVSVTDAQLEARANGFAIITANVSEIGQFKTETPTFGADYDLTDVSRGLLGTTAAVHGTGNRFVMLQNVLFLPLDVNLSGRTLIFRPVSIGTPAANNATYSVLFDPRFTGPANFTFETTSTGDKVTTSTGAFLEVTLP
jgi:hypothetical protein